VRGSGQGTAEVRALVAGRERTARCVVAIAPVDSEEPAVLRDAACVPGSPQPSRSCACGSWPARRVGPVHGASVVLLEVHVEGGEFVEPLLQQAAAKALAAAIEQAGRVELEPWVQIEVWCPEDTSAAVLADLGSRGALVSGRLVGPVGRISARARAASAHARLRHEAAVADARARSGLAAAGRLRTHARVMLVRCHRGFVARCA
jgi:hypothetical protein